MATGPRPNYHQVFRVADRGGFVYDWKLTAPKFELTKVDLAHPGPLDDPFQRIRGAKLVAAGTQQPSVTVFDNSPFKRPLLLVSYNAERAHEVSARLEFQAELMANDIVSGPAAAGSYPVLSETEAGPLLAPTETYDYGSPEVLRFRTEHGLALRPGEELGGYAVRLAKAVHEAIRYRTVGTPDRRVASDVCKAGTGDCGHYASLTIANLRLSGIAARMPIGRLANGTGHAWVEAYIPYFGWLFLDPQSGRYGKAPGDRIAFHYDWDLKIPTAQFGERQEPSLQTVKYWLRVRPGGSGEGVVIDDHWARVPPT